MTRAPHPSAWRLARFVGRTEDGEADAESRLVREHLAGCAECRRIVDDLADGGAPRGEDEERDRAWEALRERIGSEAQAIVPARARPARSGLWAAAAALATVGLLLAGWLAVTSRLELREAHAQIAQLETELANVVAPHSRLQARIDAAPATEESDGPDALEPESVRADPHARIAAVDLVPRGALRSGDEPAAIVLGGDAELILLRLLLTGSGEGALHRLEASSDGGMLLWSVAEVTTDATEQAIVAVPVERLSPGTIELDLLRVDTGEVAARYTLSVRAGEAPGSSQ